MPTLDEALEELARVPPDEFTGRRNALAAQLEKAGQKSAAVRVKARRKPSVPLWAVNRLAREEPDRIGQLIDAVDQMKAAQLGRGGDLAAIGRHQRATVGFLLKCAEDLLRKAALGVSHQTRLRVEKTLIGAAADPNEREALRAGRVEHELVPAGFEVFGDAMPRLVPKPAAPVPGPRPQPGPARAPAAVPPRREPASVIELRARVEKAREARARDAVEAQERHEHEKARRRADETRRAVEEAARALARAKEEVKRATEALRQSEKDARAAERALADHEASKPSP